MSKELSFVAKVISGRRITIYKDVAEALNIEEGDKLSIKVQKIEKEVAITQ